MSDQAALVAQHAAALIETCRGAVFCLLGLGAFCLLPSRIRRWLAMLPGFNINGAFVALFGLLLITAASYLFYPGYLDHLEPTIATLGQVLARGDSLYPLSSDFYPYHGLLYGPGLALSQWVVSGLDLPVLIGSKLPSVLALMCSIPLMWKACENPLARGYLLLLLPFGFILFWARAEPLFLLLVCLVLSYARRQPVGWQLAIVVGLLAGGASALKIHGAIYVLAAYLAATVCAPLAVLEVALIGAVAVPAFLVFFSSSNISLQAFYTYLQLAGKHGLSLRVWLGNALFLAFMLTPVALLLRREVANWKLLGLFACELLVSVLAAKPAAGSHHLIPFIPINAYLIQQLCMREGIRDDVRVRVLYACVTIPAILTVLSIATSLGGSWAPQLAARRELLQLDRSYGRLTMGVTDDRGYPLSYLRVTLRGEQIDYAAYMDLAFAGIQPGALADRIRSCAIGALVLPKEGEPFSMSSFYTYAPLFPADIAARFNASYQRLHTGNFFSVYACKPAPQPG